MGYSSGVAGGVAASSENRGYGGGGKWGESEEKLNPEKERIRKIAIEALSIMPEAIEAKKKEKEEGDVLRYYTGYHMTSFEKIFFDNLSKTEEAVEQAEKEGGLEQTKGAIEALEEVVKAAEKRKGTTKNKDAEWGLKQVINEASQNIKIRKAVLEYYKFRERKLGNNVFEEKSIDTELIEKNDENNLNQTRKRIEEVYKNPKE